MKRWFLLAALSAGQAMAQSADISGAQLVSGEADARLQAVAREAAAANRKLVISAPEYWHEMILEQVRRGGGDAVQVEVRDSFAEAVMVRSDAIGGAEAEAAAPVAAEEPVPVAAPAPAPAAVPAPAPAPAPRPAAPVAQPAPAPAPAARPAPVVAAPQPAQAPVVPAPRPVAPAPAPAPRPAATATPQPVAAQPVPAAPRPVAPAPAPRPAAQPAPAAPQPVATQPAPAAPAAPAATTGSAQAEVAAIKRRLEQSLNEGEPITRVIEQTALEPKDVLYVRGEVIAVQRRDSLRSQLYWLEGGIELLRVELRESGPNRYVVMEPIRNVDSPRLRAVRSEERDLFTAAEPGRHAQERTALERRYNGGNRIEATLSPNQLNQRDVVYVGDDLVVVVRVNGLELERYFLVGRINLGRGELLKDGNNKYRVLRDIRQ